MARKQLYKIVDSKGRVYLPVESRRNAGIESGDIVRLNADTGKISVSKVELIELGDKSPEALAAYILAGVPHLSNAQLQELMERVLSCFKTKNTAGGQGQ